MDWRDEGALIAVRPHGESSAIIEVFTQGHGRHAGVVRGAASRRLAPVLQPGNQVEVTWRARLDTHIGAFTVEPLRSRSALLGDARALGALNALCALLHHTLPERDPHPGLYDATRDLLDRVAAGDGWETQYLRWELCLLDELGYGLDLGRCALSGTREDLAYVSPTSGRAVARAAAGEWAARLLPLPPCLLGQGPAGPGELQQGLRTTGHFLARLMADLGRDVPEARIRLSARLGQA